MSEKRTIIPCFSYSVLYKIQTFLFLFLKFVPIITMIYCKRLRQGEHFVPNRHCIYILFYSSCLTVEFVIFGLKKFTYINGQQREFGMAWRIISIMNISLSIRIKQQYSPSLNGYIAHFLWMNISNNALKRIHNFIINASNKHWSHVFKIRTHIGTQYKKKILNRNI